MAFALAGLYITHRRVHQQLDSAGILIDNGVVGWFFSGVMVLYGVTLGLIAVATWQESSRVSELASREAAAISALYRDLDGYPEPLRGKSKERLRDYTRVIIDKVWPAQRRGEIIEDGTHVLNGFRARMLAFEPATPGQQIATARRPPYNHMIEIRANVSRRSARASPASSGAWS